MTPLILLAVVVLLVAIWGVRMLMLSLRVDVFKKYWLDQNNMPPQPNQLVYFVLGDSTAQGIGAGKPEQSYPYLVARWLEKQTARPVKIINLSVSGATVEDAFTKQLPQMYRMESPHVVTLAIGANNIKNYAGESFEATMSNLIRALPPESYVADVPCFTGKAKADNWKVIEACNAIRRTLQGTNHHAVALYEATKVCKGWRYFAADWFHPNARAYQKWATAFELQMAERIPELIELKR